MASAPGTLCCVVSGAPAVSATATAQGLQEVAAGVHGGVDGPSRKRQPRVVVVERGAGLGAASSTRGPRTDGLPTAGPRVTSMQRPRCAPAVVEPGGQVAQGFGAPGEVRGAAGLSVAAESAGVRSVRRGRGGGECRGGGAQPVGGALARVAGVEKEQQRCEPVLGRNLHDPLRLDCGGPHLPHLRVVAQQAVPLVGGALAVPAAADDGEGRRVGVGCFLP